MEAVIDAAPPGKNYSAYLHDFWKQSKDRESRVAQIIAELASEPEKMGKFFEREELRSIALATRQCLPEIERANRADAEEIKKRMSDLWRQMPCDTAPQPNAIKEFFMEWRCSDKKVFKSYGDYAQHQKALLAAWIAKQKEAEEKDAKLFEEEKLIGTTKEDGTGSGIGPMNRLLKLYAQQCERPNLLQAIKNKAADMLGQNFEFSGYRNLKKIVEEAKANTAALGSRHEQIQGQGFSR